MKNLATLLLLCLPFLTNGLLAQSGPVGIVDIEMILQKSKAGKALTQELAKSEMEARKALDEKMQEYRDREKEIQLSTSSDNVDTQQKSVFELQKMQTEIRRTSETMDADQKMARSKKINDFEKTIRPIVESVAAEKGLAVVLRQTADANIFYYNSSVDITNEVIEKLDSM